MKSESFDDAVPVTVVHEELPEDMDAPEGMAPLVSNNGTNGILGPEEQVIGACLLDEGPTLEKAIAAGLDSTDFSPPYNDLIFGSLRRMHAAKTPIGLDTLVTELGPRIGEAGGVIHLMALADPIRIPTTAKAGHYIEQVRKASAKRRLVRTASELVERVNAGEDMQEVAPLIAQLKAAPTEVVVSVKPELVARSLMDFTLPAADDPSVLIGNRWLSRGDLFILASTSGMGKSSLSIQAATTWALGRPLFGGFKPSRPLRSLMFQSEDSEGDIAEVRMSLEYAMKLTAEEIQQVRERVLIVTDRVHRGLSFRAEIKAQLLAQAEQQDIVWINPLLAFIGGDVKDSTDVGLFIREQLNSLNEPPRFAYAVVHHANKPPKEKKDRQWNEVMYEMTGSADLTNAARAIISLQATAKEGEFNLILAKRGARAGLTKLVPGTINTNLEFEQATSTITIKHSTERMPLPGRTDDIQVIHWERCEPTDGSEAAQNKGGRPSKYSFDEFAPYCPKPGEDYLPANVIHKRIRGISGISPSAFRDLMSKTHKEGRIDRKEQAGIGMVYGYRVVTGGNGGNLFET